MLHRFQVLRIFALLLFLPPAHAATGIISVDPDERVYDDGAAAKPAKKNKKGKAKGVPAGGDVQVGPDAPRQRPEVSPRKAPKQGVSPAGSRVPGIFAVYEADGRWMLIERGAKRAMEPGAALVVIGSRGLDQFRLEKATKTYQAACDAGKPAARRGWYLTSQDAKAFKRVGTPVIAIMLKAGARFDASAARFSALKNEINETLYKKLEKPLREAILADLADGSFQMDIGDEEGHRTAAKPDTERLRLKIDFAARLKLAGYEDPLLVVEGAEYSRSYRRCLRLMDGGQPVGSCVEMPHELMAETQALEFVAYDPSRAGRPFILAFTEKKPPLWGHERWGFQTTPDGAKSFMRDALDPRCRDAF